MNLIQKLEQEEIARIGKTIPDFVPGDTVIVSVKVVEGERKRVQAFEGVVVAKKNRGINSSFIVRKISSGEGVERTFQTHSPIIASIEIKRRGDVSRAKLYYLRQRSGKSARIKEKLGGRAQAEAAGEILAPAAPVAPVAAPAAASPSRRSARPRVQTPPSPLPDSPSDPATRGALPIRCARC